MRTAVAADEPEPERQRYLAAIATGLTSVAAGGQSTATVVYTFPPTSSVTVPLREAFLRGAGSIGAIPASEGLPEPWQCPDCQLWMSPAVATHRCT